MMMNAESDDSETQKATFCHTDVFCIACGSKIEENSFSCKCGHVHETDRKWINGKRYSAYREQLYSKLTSQELLEANKKKSQPPTKKRKLSDNIQEQKKSLKNRRRKTAKNPKSKKYQYGGNLRHAYGTTFSAVDHSEKNSEKNSENFYPTRWNLEFALEDINRRFLKQNLFWIKV